MANTTNKEFLNELALLLEKHNKAICSKSENIGTSVFFMDSYIAGADSNRIPTRRCHISANDIKNLAQSVDD